MKTLSVVIAVPLTVLAYNISMKMDSHNIDQLINGVFIALIVLAVVVPGGLYVLAYLRDRRLDDGGAVRPVPRQWGAPRFGEGARSNYPVLSAPHRAGALPTPGGAWGGSPWGASWGAPPPLLEARPEARRADAAGSFVVQQQQPFFEQQEEWS